MIPKIKFKNEEIPIFVLGTWNIRNEKNMIETIRYGILKGLNHIDTAQIYGNAEEIIGKIVKEFNREKIFITTKIPPYKASFKETILSCENSLKRLKTDYIDLYLLHWYEKIYPLEETFSAFLKLIDEKKIRYAGVSNFAVPELEKAIDILPNLKIFNNQVKYNLDNFYYIEEKLLPFCEKKEILISGYSPFWTGKIPKENKNWKIIEKISKKYNATPFQIILNFLSRKRKIFIIFKTENIEHLKENLSSLNFEIEEEDIKKIFEEFSKQKI